MRAQHFCLASAGADPGFQVRGDALKKIAPNGGRRENFWGLSCEKSRFYATKSYFFQFQGGEGGTGCAPWISLCHSTISKFMQNAINDIFETVKK
jgi:hypothetical protein